MVLRAQEPYPERPGSVSGGGMVGGPHIDAIGRTVLAEVAAVAATVSGAERLVAATADSPQLSALCHNYRFYAMVAEARELIRTGEIGEVHQVHPLV